MGADNLVIASEVRNNDKYALVRDSFQISGTSYANFFTLQRVLDDNFQIRFRRSNTQFTDSSGNTVSVNSNNTASHTISFRNSGGSGPRIVLVVNYLGNSTRILLPSAL